MSSNEIKPPKTQSLAEVSLDDDSCREDFSIMDRYQSFSSELLRVALLGIAVCGFLLKEVYFAEKHDSFLAALKGYRHIFQFGMLSLALCAAFALAHRYVSSDSMAFQVGYLRLRKLRDAAGEGDAQYQCLNAKMATEKSRYRNRLKMCWWWLLLAAIFHVLGVLALAFTFSQTLFT